MTVVWLIAAFAGYAYAEKIKNHSYEEVFALGVKVAYQAMNGFKSIHGDKVLVISNASHVRIRGADSSPVLDAIGRITGATLGKGNLLALHDAPGKPLFIFFYDAISGDSLYIELEDLGHKEQPRKLTDMSFSKETFEREFLSLSERPEALEQRVRERVFGGNEMRLFMVTWLWNRRISMELRNAILFHDHFCPGVTSGYYIAQYLRNHFPLSKGQAYYIIASPPYCKDDAIQAILNTTVGKRSMAVIPLSESDTACLSAVAKDAAGLYFRYNRKEKKGNGIILGFLWDKLRSDAGFTGSQKPSLIDHLRLAQWMIEHEDKYENYLRVIKEISLEGGLIPEDFARPGINPWLKAGLWECQNLP